MDKLEVEINQLSKAKIKIEFHKAIIFFIINLMTNQILKLYTIIYNFKTKLLLVTFLHFVDKQ